MSTPADYLSRVFRWAARILGTGVAGFWLFIGVVSAVDEPFPRSWESWVMAVLMLGAGVAIGISWWQEGLGGALVIAVGAAHSAFALIASGHRRLCAMAISGGPFLVVGALFMAVWHRSRRNLVRAG